MRKRALLLALLVPAAMVVALPADAACAGGFPASRFDGYMGQETSRAFYPVEESDPAAGFQVFTHSGCGGNVSVSYGTSGGTAEAGSGGDYMPESGVASHPNAPSGEDFFDPDSVTILPDSAVEPVVESTNLALSNPVNVSLSLPSVAGVLIVDDDGAGRFGFEGIPYSQSETFTAVSIPVFRAGTPLPAGSVGWSITGSGANPATPGEDVNPASGTASFGSSRWAMINLTLSNDKLEEGPEEFTITLAGGSPDSMTFTIEDNEEGGKPTSRFHHPRQGWRYKKSDFRIREVHVFVDDNLGPENVVAVDFALRRNLKNQDCVWLTKSGWEKKDCQNREWLVTGYDDVGQLWRYRLKQLKSSVGTKIKNYTAFARAIDGAGNVESDFDEKRNANTFEIKRSKPKR